MKTLPDTRQKLKFVDCVPTGITCSLNNSPCVALKEEAQIKRSVSLLNNSNSIAINFEKQALKYDKLYSPRAFVHWLVGEGLESGETSE